MKRFLGLLILFFAAIAQAEEAIKVQSVPTVQAVNLAPIETPAQVQQNVIQLKPQTEQVIRVQASPTVPQNPAPVKQVQQTPTTTTVPTTPIINKTPATIAPQENQKNSNITTPAAINMETCSKMFNINAENLFILTLGAIKANNFEIKEIQSHNGYITFKAMNKEFLATVAKVDNKNSMVKINPTNGVYHFAPGIVAKIFEYISYKLTK